MATSKKPKHKTSAHRKSTRTQPRQRAISPELILGGTILLGRAGGRAVGRAATETYAWLKDKLKRPRRAVKRVRKSSPRK